MSSLQNKIRTGLRCLFLLGSVLAVFLGLAGPLAGAAFAQPSTNPHALVISIDGVINPVKVRYIGRALAEAQESGAVLLIIRLDTPGGLLGSTRDIVELLLDAPVPTAVYVSPSGAQAGSAGTFITAAANFAVMAPGSNIGAATPVSSTGQDLDETLASKVENDAAALIRSIAQERGRNAKLLEDTVREAASYSAQEALDGDVVDFIGEDIEDLLMQIDGMTADTAEGPVVLETEGIPTMDLDKSFLENVLEFLADPNVSFLLFTLGGLGIIIELFNPGLLVPVIVGCICLILAFVGVGNLPVNWAGVALILLAIALGAGEVVVAGFGILGVASAVSLVIGGLLLFAQFGESSPTLPYIGVNRWLLVAVSVATGGAVIYLARQVVKSRRDRPEDATAAIIGRTGSVTITMQPRGAVRVANDTWTAISADGAHIEAGEQIRVVSVDGLVLIVARRDPPS